MDSRQWQFSAGGIWESDVYGYYLVFNQLILLKTHCDVNWNLWIRKYARPLKTGILPLSINLQSQ